MAEENEEAQAEVQEEQAKPKKEKKSIVPLLMMVINTLVVAAIAVMLFLDKSADEANPDIQDIDTSVSEEETELIGQLVPLETFLVNLAGAKGRKLMKITMSLEVENTEVQEEIEKRKPQIRDIILILLSSKTYDQVSTKEGKNFLRTEIRDTVNSFLTKGKVKRILFTEFFYN